MLTNPDMIRQSMQFPRMMDPNAGMGSAGGAASAFPAPGGDAPEEGSNTEHYFLIQHREQRRD
ncbi:CGH_1_HP_G0099440.mRNA.1.CDS.1 [Saccharomyces cerevisiae]|nr:CGH_1_HP_G0099440.mRNA.1.CDS.1 [Saccharomyces cerevisiae]CAI6946234.1 CGH_1_HP_G0099440.mRNA.1.CDS.1 [Saccharomyces cerevisiae]